MQIFVCTFIVSTSNKCCFLNQIMAAKVFKGPRRLKPRTAFLECDTVPDYDLAAVFNNRCSTFMSILMTSLGNFSPKLTKSENENQNR